jgi:hypothetical protein
MPHVDWIRSRRGFGRASESTSSPPGLLTFVGILAVAALLTPTSVRSQAADPIPASVWGDSAVAISSPAACRVYVTRRTEAPPRIDGHLDDLAWETVEWAGGFLQREPTEGVPPTGQTAFKILYDDQAIYLAYRAFDPEPAKISRILARRDYFPGDWVEVNIDSYHDHRTAFSFTTSASGVRGDEFISDDGDQWDSNWDPIWQAATATDREGWTAEARIPLSQLRYSDAEDQVWGIQVHRRIHRMEERSTWQPIPKNGSGWVSRFGELRGIQGIRPRARREFLPYVVSKAERSPAVRGDPFHDGGNTSASGGLDGKIGFAGNMTLDVTINPDFGQVEADPSVVNLSAFESYFDERRPFFIEGSNILNFHLAPSVAFGNHTTDQLFYSRRIGRSPQHQAGGDGGFVDQPSSTSILGAAKLSGKTAGGLSIAFLESVTSRERANVSRESGEREWVDVEPRTNYSAGRVQQDFRQGRTRIGAMLTSVNRSIEEEGTLDFLHRNAFAGGVDLFSYFRGRRYYITLHEVGSDVRGSKEAILRTQLAPARYFQRPDNRGANVDSARTSLAGHAGSLLIGKSEGDLRAEIGAAWRSPGFEVNDLGFVRSCNELNQFAWAGYSIRNPVSIFRRVSFNVNQFVDFEYVTGEKLKQALNHNGNATFRNNWNVNWSATRDNERVSNYELRGGPSIRLPGDWNADLNVSGDERRSFVGGVGVYAGTGDDRTWKSTNVWSWGRWRPTSALSISFEPSYGHDQSNFQYVTTSETSLLGGVRYVYARMDQKTLSASIRLDLAVNPSLTIQYYGAPFVAAGRYRDYKRVGDPRAANVRNRWVALADDAVRYDTAGGVYEVDENGDSSVDYTFGKPDFKVRDLHSNLVVRWEYSPGSLLYLVWQQERSGSMSNGRFGLRDDLDGLFGIQPTDVFLLKISRWFSL